MKIGLVLGVVLVLAACGGDKPQGNGQSACAPGGATVAGDMNASARSIANAYLDALLKNDDAALLSTVRPKERENFGGSGEGGPDFTGYEFLRQRDVSADEAVVYVRWTGASREVPEMYQKPYPVVAVREDGKWWVDPVKTAMAFYEEVLGD